MIIEVFGFFINSESIRKIYEDVEINDMFGEPEKYTIIDMGFLNKIRIYGKSARAVSSEINEQLKSGGVK